MDQIDKEYKNRFNDQQLSNENFEVDDLWEGISEELGGQPEVHIQSYKNHWKLLVAVLIFVVANIGVVMYYMTINDNSKVRKTVIVSIDESLIVDSKSILNKENAEDIIKEEIVNNVTQTTNNKHQSKTLASSIVTNELNYNYIGNEINKSFSSNITELDDEKNGNFRSEKEGVLTSDRSSKLKPNLFNEVLIERTEDTFDFEMKVSEILSNTIVEENTNEKRLSNDLNIAPLDLLPRKGASIILIEHDLPSIGSIVETPIKFEETKGLGFNVYLVSGINTTKFGYKSKRNSDLALNKTSTERSSWGNSFGIGATMLMNNKLLLRSGVEFTNMWTVFDYIKRGKTKSFKENQLLIVRLDIHTGDTLKTTYGDKDVDGINTRWIVHHNLYQQFNIPLEFGLQSSHGNFEYGFTAGVVFNFTITQLGRVLDENSIVSSFSNESLLKSINDFGIGLAMSPFINYKVADHWNISLHPQWRWQHYSGFEGTDMKLSIHQLGLNIGVGYSF